MAQVRTYVGLDAHAVQTQAATLDRDSGELGFRRVTGAAAEVLEYLQGLPAPVVAAYEAGPVGYGLARAAVGAGVEVRVCAPGSIPRKPTARIKTDRRDAERLARLLAAGELDFVRVPTPAEEQYRDLARCREAARGDLMRARHRLSRFLCRRELRFPGAGAAWAAPHRAWLRRLRLPDPPSRAVLADYLAAVDDLHRRRDQLDASIAECWRDSPWAAEIARLRCLRGIDTLSAFGICAEVGDFTRFDHPRHLAAYLGLVPAEHSSGHVVRRGSITKAGSPFARRLLIEAAHHYRHRPAITTALKRRQHGQDPRAAHAAWRAQRRLYAQWHKLRQRRHKPANVVVTALARELCTYVWEVATLP